MSYHLHPPTDRAYWDAIKLKALSLQSDGCSGVPDFYQEVCYEHDVHYRTHRFLDGRPITKEVADLLLNVGIKDRSLFGAWSPMAWWRWKAVRWWGGPAWHAADTTSPLIATLRKIARKDP